MEDDHALSFPITVCATTCASNRRHREKTAIFALLKRPLPARGPGMSCAMVWVTTRCTVNPGTGRRRVRSAPRREPTSRSSTPKKSPKLCNQCSFLLPKRLKRCGPLLAFMTYTLKDSTSPSSVSLCDHSRQFALWQDCFLPKWNWCNC